VDNINRIKINAGVSGNFTGYIGGGSNVGSMSPTKVLGSTATQVTTNIGNGTANVFIVGIGLLASSFTSVEIVNLETEKSIYRVEELSDFFTGVILGTLAGPDLNELLMVDGKKYLLLINEDPFDGLLPCTPSSVGYSKAL